MISKRKKIVLKKGEINCISVWRTFQSLSRAVFDLANPRVVSADEMPRLLGGGALHDSSGLGTFDQGVFDTLDVRATHGCKEKQYR